LAIKRWQDFFVEKQERLYNWVSDRRVACENNRAERELRPTVIARKVSFGSQAEEGAKTRARLDERDADFEKESFKPKRKIQRSVGANYNQP
jgi:hypothetical protein